MQAVLEKITLPTGSSWRFFVRQEKTFKFAWHSHPEYELTWIVQGHGKRFVGDHMESYQAGDLVFLGANLPHTWASEADSQTQQAVVIQFAHTFLGDHFFETPELQSISRLLSKSRQGLRICEPTTSQIIPKIRLLQEQKGILSLLSLISLLDHLAKATSKHLLPLSSPSFAPSLQRGDSARVDQICRYIHEHLDEPLTAREATRVLKMSPRTFSRFFRSRLGRTFHTYIQECRIGRACSMLIQSDLTVTEICHASGFENLAYFNRKFLQLKKMTPRQYRLTFRRTETQNLSQDQI